MYETAPPNHDIHLASVQVNTYLDPNSTKTTTPRPKIKKQPKRIYQYQGTTTTTQSPEEKSNIEFFQKELNVMNNLRSGPREPFFEILQVLRMSGYMTHIKPLPDDWVEPETDDKLSDLMKWRILMDRVDEYYHLNRHRLKPTPAPPTEPPKSSRWHLLDGMWG